MYQCLNENDKASRKFMLRDVAVIEVFFATGARVYEISNIRDDSINLNTGLIRLMGKGGKERYVQISNTSILEVLKKYYDENEQSIKKSGYFFVNNREKQVYGTIYPADAEEVYKAGWDREKILLLICFVIHLRHI